MQKMPVNGGEKRPAKKLTKRKIQALETRNEIIKRSKELLATKRYEDITVKDICEACNISIGAYYHYFQSKEDLVLLYYLEFDQYIETIRDEVRALPPRQAVQRLIECEMNYVRTNITYPTQIFIMQLKTQEKYFLDMKRPFIKEIFFAAERLIAECPPQTLYTAEELAALLMRLSRGVLYDWCTKGGSYDLTRTALEDIRLMLGGLWAMA